MRNEHLLLRRLATVVTAVAVCAVVGCTPYQRSRVCVEEAPAELRLAASGGDAEAQLDLGLLYLRVFWQGNSDGDRCTLAQVARKYTAGDLAVRWLHRAAEQEHSHAQSVLGYLYADGDIVAEDHAEAVTWWRRAAEQGHPRARSSLAEMYENGRGVPRDLVAAYVWYSLAESVPWSRGQSSPTVTPAENSTRIAALLTSRQIAEARALLRAR